MLVVDASAVAELLIGTARGARVRERVGDHGLHAPHLLSVEVASVARRLVRTGEIELAPANRVVRELDELGVEWYEHLMFLPRCLELRESVTAYDAVYVALAEVLRAPLLTCDAKLAGAHGHRADIVLVDA